METQVKLAESCTKIDLRQWCVTLKYNFYRAFPLSVALAKGYPIVCITLNPQ